MSLLENNKRMRFTIEMMEKAFLELNTDYKELKSELQTKDKEIERLKDDWKYSELARVKLGNRNKTLTAQIELLTKCYTDNKKYRCPEKHPKDIWCQGCKNKALLEKDKV